MFWFYNRAEKQKKSILIGKIAHKKYKSQIFFPFHSFVVFKYELTLLWDSDNRCFPK